MSRIVVGVDGSDESAAALRWAVEEAGLRKAKLEVVYVYESVPAWQMYGYADPLTGTAGDPLVRDLEQIEGAAKEAAEALLHSMVAEHDDAAVDIESLAVDSGRPAEVLVQQSRTADMLVVGSRGRGGFSELLLGSVSHQAANHAVCPVVILGRHHKED